MSNAVVNGKTSAIECRSCGASEPLVLPSTIDDVVAQAQAFAGFHKKCAPKSLGELCHRCRNGENVFRGEKEWVHGAYANRVRCEASNRRDEVYGAVPGMYFK